ncbi:MAG: DUF819 family protein [Planctomycetota bacterium]
MTAPLAVLAILALNVAVAELLARHTPLRHLGTALLVIVTTAACANVGLIPTVTQGSPVYDAVFDPVAYLAIFLLLLQVDLAAVWRAGGTMIALFLVGSLGTLAGVVVGMHVVDGALRFGELHRAFGGMFVGTYVGGSLNFNTIALQYGVEREPVLLAAANAVDSGMTTVWMVLGIAVPRLLRRALGRGRRAVRAEPVAVERTGSRTPPSSAAPLADHGGVAVDTEKLHPIDLAWCLALASLGLFASKEVAAALSRTWLLDVPMVIVLTVFALVLAQTPLARGLRGTRTLGMFGVYLFLAVIGALCDVGALRQSGELGLWITLLVCVVFAVHGLLVFGVAALLRLDLDAASVASQANIGGGTTALALARSLGRPDLVLPAILVGSLGTALGTFLGVLTAERLL